MSYASGFIRSTVHRHFLTVATVVLIGSLTHTIGAADRVADLVMRNGAVYTVDASRSWTSSVAVIGNRIEFVGNDSDAESYIGPDTQVIDLAGRMLLPGFHDSHVHSQSAAHSATKTIRFDEIDNIEAVRQRILEFAIANPELPWIDGAGLDDELFVSAVDNPREFLDELVPDRPIVLTSTLIFKSWTNSEAFEVSGITAETPDPPNGSIARDPETGEPNGTFLNRAIDMVYRFQPEPSADLVLANYRHTLSKFSTHGVTAIMEASAHPVYSVQAYSELADAGELNHRVRICFAHDSTSVDGEQIEVFVEARNMIRERFPNGEVRADCVKLFLDGFVLVHGGALLQDYADRPGFRGKPDIEYKRLEELMTALDVEGFQIKAHSIGTRSAREFIDAVDATQTQSDNPNDLRHHISHAEVVHPDDIGRMRALGMPVEVTPMAAVGGGTDFLGVLGRERTATYIHSFNSFIQEGIAVVFGNDWMGADTVDSYESLSQPANIEVAVTRLAPGDTSTDTDELDLFREYERLSLPDAIAAYTIQGAYLMHDEADSGSIEVGKLADFVVLDKNLFDVPVHSIHGIKIDMTIFGGEVVYERM